MDVKIKRDAAGIGDRYKARLVAKGFMHRESFDFTEVFTPVSTLWTLLTPAAVNGVELHQLDNRAALLIRTRRATPTSWCIWMTF